MLGATYIGSVFSEQRHTRQSRRRVRLGARLFVRDPLCRLEYQRKEEKKKGGHVGDGFFFFLFLADLNLPFGSLGEAKEKS